MSEKAGASRIKELEKVPADLSAWRLPGVGWSMGQ